MGRMARKQPALSFVLGTLCHQGLPAGLKPKVEWSWLLSIAVVQGKLKSANFSWRYFLLFELYCVILSL